MPIQLTLWRRPRRGFRQRLLPFFERAGRREHRFKTAIVVLTMLVVLGLVAGTPIGRYASARVTYWLRTTCNGVLGLEPARQEIDAELRAKRALGIERTHSRYRAYFEQDTSPGLRRILTAAAMAPDDVLLRWANGHWTVVFSPLVFQADPGPRGYRMRPNVRSFWLQNHVMTRGLTSFFFLPDTAEVRAAVTAAHQAIMPESYQTTNAWGYRGPEPDPKAPYRVLVLGDSFMQGIFLPEADTPPEHLRRHLESAWAERVSILNTGHIGYSPEQYFFTLRDEFERFHPQFIVLSVCPNDFGDAFWVLAGRGDWAEARYWLGEIDMFCRSRQIPCLLVAAPFEVQVLGPRDAGNYPGQVSNLWKGSGFHFLDPVDAFIDEHLRLMAEAIRGGHRPATSPLYNGHLHDAHFSASGAATWGKAVGRRLERLRDYAEAGTEARRK